MVYGENLLSGSFIRQWQGVGPGGTHKHGSRLSCVSAPSLLAVRGSRTKEYFPQNAALLLNPIIPVCLPVEAAKEFRVGEDLVWRQPGLNDSDVYSQWAARNRFHVGDSLSFTYKNDSVLEVDKWDYYHCNTSNPVIDFDNGKSIMKLDRPGPFYFISGAPDHCKNGQRLFVEVIDLPPIVQSPPPFAAPPEQYLPDDSPAPAPAPAPSPSLGVAISITPWSLAMPLVVTLLALAVSSSALVL